MFISGAGVRRDTQICIQMAKEKNLEKMITRKYGLHCTHNTLPKTFGYHMQTISKINYILL